MDFTTLSQGLGRILKAGPCNSFFERHWTLQKSVSSCTRSTQPIFIHSTPRRIGPLRLHCGLLGRLAQWLLTIFAQYFNFIFPADQCQDPIESQLNAQKPMRAYAVDLTDFT